MTTIQHKLVQAVRGRGPRSRLGLMNEHESATPNFGFGDTYMQMPPDVNFKVLASARVVCNIVYVQVQSRIYKELCCENKFLSKLILF